MKIDWRLYVRTHLPPLDIRAEREAEIREELAQQLESVYAAAVASGCSVEESEARAAAEIGDWQELAFSLCRIESRAQPPALALAPAKGAFMRGFLFDIRHATRGLLRSPAYTSIATLTLALGLGLGVAAFSLVDGILLRPLPYGSSERLVLMKATVPPENTQTPEITYPDAMDVSQATDVFASVSAALPFAGTTTTTDPPSRVEGLQVSSSLFGLYGTVAYMVAQRTREMGVRLALGATAAQIRRLVMARGLQLVVVGLVIGLAAAFAFGHAIEAQLFGIVATNLPALAIAATVLISAAAAACVVPAVRATRVNPVDALRAE